METINELNCQSCNCRAEIFSHMTEEQLAETNRHKTVVRYNAGETIFKQGSPCRHVISFVHGNAMVYIEGGENKKIILNFIKPTEFISGISIFSDQLHHFSVKALSDSMVCFIDLPVFKKVIRDNRDFAEGFINKTQEITQMLFKKLTSTVTKNQLGRLAESILYMRDFYGQDEFRLDVSKKELAEMANISRESMYRLLHDLVEEGIITNPNGTLKVLNRELLEEISRRG